MRILINDVVISFELENETTAGDVYEGIARWLRASGNRVQSVVLNGDSVDVPSGDGVVAWSELPLERVEELAVTASSIYQGRIDQLETIITYVDLFRRVMNDGTDDEFASVLEELPHVAAGIARLTPELAGLLEEPIKKKTPGDREARAAAAARAADLSRALVQRQREFLDPEHEMRITVTALEAILPEFESVPVQMQTGQEAAALELVARFSELAARMFRLMPIILEIRPELEQTSVNGMPLVESMPKLNEVLSELEEAMRIRDLVLIGDVMEYELFPHFTQLAEVFRAPAAQ